MAKVVKGEERGRPGRWLVDYRDGAGVRHWRTFDSKREAENFADEHRPRARQRAGQPKVDTRIKLRDYVTRWLALVDANPRTKPATKAIYRRTLEGLWVPRFGAVRLQWLERDALRACLLGELSAGRAPNTVAIQLAVLRTMLQHAIVEDLVLTVNPAAGLGKILGLSRDRLSEDVKALDRAELVRFLEAARDVAPRYCPLLLFLARTGARGGEGRALQWVDLDLPRRRATIARTFGFRDLVGRPKSGKPRKIDLTPQLVEALRRVQVARAEEKLKAGWPTLAEWVFTEPDGQPIERRRFERAFARILKAAGLPAHHTPHSLRHSYASILISEGASPVYVSKQLGHHSVAITTRVYTEWLDGDSTPLVHRAPIGR